MDNFYSMGRSCPNFWLKIAIFGIGCLPFFTVRAQKTDSLKRDTVKSSLKDTTELQEVVVNSGYQAIGKERATGSFDHINTELFNRKVATNVLDHIENLTPGLLFDHTEGAPDAMLLRGRNTLYGDAELLIVVDNFPYDGDISSINPNDVSSVTILKDAAAASIWGARAGNGVIVITTKQGLSSRPSISFNNNVTFRKRPDVRNVPTISSPDYIELEQYLYDQGFYTASINNSVAGNALTPFTPVIELLIRRDNGLASDAETKEAIDRYKSIDARDDIERYLYREGFSQQHALSISGNSPAINYYFSAGYDRNRANLVGDSRNRVTLRSQNTFRLTSKLSLAAGITFSNSQEADGNNRGYLLNNGTAKGLYPYASLADDQGNALPIVYNLRSTFVDTAGQGKLLDWMYRPLDDIDKDVSNINVKDYTLQTALTYNLYSWLKAEVRYQFLSSGTQNQRNSTLQSYYTRDLINRYYQPGAVNEFPIPKGDILQQTSSNVLSHQGRVQFSIDKTFSADHQLTAIAGWEIKEKSDKGYRETSYGYVRSGNQIASTMDYLTKYPQHIYGPSAVSWAIPIPSGQSISETRDRFISYFANASYLYANRYTLSLSAREDAANLFGVSANQRGTPLWSAGLAWQVNKEPGYTLSWLPELKLRATYGYNGNISRFTSAFSTIRYSSGAALSNLRTAQIMNPPNENLRWEQVRIFNAGLDFGLKGVLSGTLEYYHKQVKDVIGQAPVDPTYGFMDGSLQSYFYGNVAGISGQGLDISLNSQPLHFGDFHWVNALNFSYAATKVSQYLMPVASSGLSYISQGYINPVIGKPIYAIYSYPWKGLDPQTGNPLGIYQGSVSMDYNDILTNTPLDSMNYKGAIQPTLFGSLRTQLDYHQFSLSVQVSYKGGYSFRRGSINYGYLYTSWSGHSDYGKRWQKPGDEQTTQVPSMIYPENGSRNTFYSNSDVLVEDGDQMRLEDVQFSYDLPQRLFKRGAIKTMRFYVYLSNLGTLYTANSLGIDPYYQTTPRERYSLSLGVQTNF